MHYVTCALTLVAIQGNARMYRLQSWIVFLCYLHCVLGCGGKTDATQHKVYSINIVKQPLMTLDVIMFLNNMRNDFYGVNDQGRIKKGFYIIC